MKSIGVAVLLAFLGLSAALADDSPLDANVVIDTSNDANTVPDTGAGAGQEKVTTPRFSVTLHNKGLDPLTNIGLRLYVVGAKNWIKQTEDKMDVGVVKVLQKKEIPLDSTADATIEMGEVEFKSSITTAVTGAGGGIAMLQSTYSGDTYQGYVLEIYINDQRVDIKVGGPSQVRRAYDDYLKKSS